MTVKTCQLFPEFHAELKSEIRKIMSFFCKKIEVLKETQPGAVFLATHARNDNLKHIQLFMEKRYEFCDFRFGLYVKFG